MVGIQMGAWGVVLVGDKWSLASSSHPTPLLLQLSSHPSHAGWFGPFVWCRLWEEVPSHLTLRKWFQSTLV